MSAWQLTVPVVLIIFNRPDTTARVFSEIARAKPAKLLVIADGPRPDRPEDVDHCAATRAVVEQVDWPCELLANYSATNLGCQRRVASGLDWVFSEVEEAIILEDDCVPHPTFFRFCQELLERYRYDERVMTISGNNFLFNRVPLPYSYYFSRYVHIWGWATWRRAWNHFDVDMPLWPDLRTIDWLQDWLGNRRLARYWRSIFEEVYQGKIDSWAYIWTFTCWVQSSLTVLPRENLVSNIGFDARATHTKRRGLLTNLQRQPLSFPLHHPPYMIRNLAADRRTNQTVFGHLRFSTRLSNRFRELGSRITGIDFYRSA